ncbi:interaptin isoform X2 [Sander lucioperca]|uniref:interaptin isoform X2 n=1 Tax=Sander lucioperca TaxID=283035 RepID=UPI00125DE50A|nr:interaptin isoform X2 [Sander lucioperca]
MAGHEWEDWFEREEFIGQISDIRVQNLQVERELVQKRTFTRWINLHLEKCDPPIEVHDLFQDIQDGHILMALLEELSGSKLLHRFKKSSHRIFRLNNIAKVLSFLEERNVKLVSIDAADVADGNSSIILGLIWNIILFFQIKELTGNIRSQFPSSSSLSSIPTSSDSDTSYCSTPSDERPSASTAMREHSKAIKKLLQWVQKRTRKYSVAVQDFGKSWTSGLAFLAVIKSIDPSLVDMRKALLRTAKENLEDSFRIAHFSLGIPRLLEPEDVTINPPDEQSIMTYVSQFLEHFPGIEEPEEPCQLIERSVSMGRLNFRNSDSNHLRNSTQQSRVKERSYMFQRACSQPPPKILISSVSEDRSSMSPPFRPAAPRSWSSEDFLADSPHMEDISSSVVEEPKESTSEVLTNLTSNSPQLSDTQSPTGSSLLESVNTESVIGDSAISSPDSWVESEFGVISEKFCESRSDSSLCDSGTAWDVYRATPVEVTTLDEEFVLSLEDQAPDESSITESYIDEGIYSLSSLESTQERIQRHSEKKQVEGVKETNLEKYNQDMALGQVPDHSKAHITKEVDSKQIDTSQSRAQEPSFGLCNAEELTNSGVGNPFETGKSNQSPLKQTSVEESTYKEPECLKKAVDFIGDGQDHEGQINGQTESQNESNNSEEFEVGTECQKKDSLSEQTRGDSRGESGVLNERGEVVVETQDGASEEVLRDYPDAQERFSSETLANMHPTNQDTASKTSLDTSMGINIPLISISSEPEEHDEEETCDPDGRDHARDDEVHQAEGTDTDVNSLENPQELGCDSNYNVDKNSVEIASCLVSENVKPTASEQIKDIESGHSVERDISRSSNAYDISGPDTGDNMAISEAKQECESPHHDFETGNTEKDLISQTSSTDAKSQPVNTEQEIDSTDQPDGHKDKLGDTFSDNETAATQQNTLESVNSKPNGTTGISCYEPGSVSRVMDLFYTDFDQNSPTEDVVGDAIEPMDLFYPDKEEPMFTEPPDTEMQSWPSVLSVSALQPAPASETQPDQPLDLLGEDDFRNGVDSIQENYKVIIKTNQETDKASISQEHCLSSGEKIGGFWGADVPGDSSDLSEAEQHSLGSARENTELVRSDSKSFNRQDESEIPPVLRQRKGARITQSMDNQTAVTAATREADNGDSDFWRSESWELYLLLLLWLLLYCFLLLPQMDLKTLPSLLLNLNH